MCICIDNRRDRRDSYHREEEPEWFSSGPVSKSDTIELRGFERERRESDRAEQGRVADVEEEDEAFEEEEKHEDSVLFFSTISVKVVKRYVFMLQLNLTVELACLRA